ncbi:response regulator [Erwinia mallotivora]|uniref:response regulator n=1 Tax=Erwinia mallotivora TaxID=69222 RepID=UPI0035E77DD6
MPATSSVHSELSKVPQVTLFFWLIKMMSTTVGETAADYLNFNPGFGLGFTSLVAGILLAVVLGMQMRARHYIPVLYWLTVVLVSIFGTLVTDNFTDSLGIPLGYPTLMFGSALILTFMLWHRSEGTLSIYSITTPLREALKAQSYAVDWVKNGDEANASLALQRYDLVLLDSGLPGQDGFSVLATLRNGGNEVPLVIITARDAL